tara:strand:+ start:107 stop:313 length:207 start_codon:yes stop_codon:yes gene_type:complete
VRERTTTKERGNTMSFNLKVILISQLILIVGLMLNPLAFTAISIPVLNIMFLVFMSIIDTTTKERGNR